MVPARKIQDVNCVDLLPMVAHLGAPRQRPGLELAAAVADCVNRCTRQEGQCFSQCTKIAHRRSLAIFTADKGIARNSAARVIFTRFHRRKNRGSLAIFFAE